MGHEYANIVMGSYMANPSATFRAMADGTPYPVKAFFVLPGDSWFERPHLMDGYGWTNVVRTSERAMEPPGECRGVYDFWREAAPGYPLELFVGVREDEFFQTGQRFIPELRARRPEPQVYVNPADARRSALDEGTWVDVETPHGGVRLQVAIRDDMPEGLLRVPHGWWKPASKDPASPSGAWLHADAQICPDDEDHLDREQGIPHFKGLPARCEGAPMSGRAEPLRGTALERFTRKTAVQIALARR